VIHLVLPFFTREATNSSQVNYCRIYFWAVNVFPPSSPAPLAGRLKSASYTTMRLIVLLTVLFHFVLGDVSTDIKSAFESLHGTESSTDDINPTGRVLTLTNGNFIDYTKSGAPFLIKFYAPWCGHCKRLAPTWDRLANALRGTVNVAKVNCDEHSHICQKFGVRGYPTLKFLRGSTATEYNGARTEPDLIAFASTLAKPIVKSVNDADYDKIIRKEINFILLYSADEVPKDALQSYLGAASSSYMGLNAYASSDSTLIKRLAPDSKLPVIAIVRDYGESVRLEQVDMSKKDFYKWLEKTKVPLVDQMDSGNAKRILSGDDGQIAVLAAVDGLGQTKEILQSMTKASKTYRGLKESGHWKGSPVTFASINAIEWKDYLANYFKVTSAPKIIIVDTQNDRYYSSFANGTEFSLDILDAVTRASQSGKGLTKTYSEPWLTRVIKRFGRFAAKLGNLFVNHPLLMINVCGIGIILLVIFILSFDDAIPKPAAAKPPVATPAVVKKTD
jgi:protein disulfide isomerase